MIHKNQILSMGITITSYADDKGGDLAATKNTEPVSGSVLRLNCRLAVMLICEGCGKDCGKETETWNMYI